MSESVTNLLASIGTKAKSGLSVSAHNVRLSSDGSGSGTGPSGLSFSSELNRVSDVRRQSTGHESWEHRSRTDDADSKQAARTSARRDDRQREIERQTDRRRRSSHGSDVSHTKTQGERRPSSSSAKANSLNDSAHRPANDRDGASAPTVSDSVDAAQLSNKLVTNVDSENVSSGSDSKLPLSEVGANESPAANILKTLGTGELLQTDTTAGAVRQSGIDLTLHANSVDIEVSGLVDGSDTNVVNVLSSLNPEQALALDAAPAAVSIAGQQVASSRLGLSTVDAKAVNSTKTLQLQSLDKFRSTADAQSTTIASSDSEDALLQSTLVSRYLVAGGLQPKGDAKASLSNTTLSVEPGSITDSDGSIPGLTPGAKDLSETSISGLHTSRLQQLADKQTDLSHADSELAEKLSGNRLMQGEATEAMQKKQFGIAQTLAMAAEGQIQVMSAKDQVASNTLASVSGGIVTAPLVSRSDGGAGPVANAPVNVPLLTPSADTTMASNVRWMVNQGVKNAVINVTPSGMGPISVQIGIEKEQMNVSIVATQGSTREALEALLPRLREQLGAQGHDSVRVDISDGRSEQSRTGGGQHSGQYQQHLQAQLDESSQQGTGFGSNDQADDEQEARVANAGEQLVGQDTQPMFATGREGMLHTRRMFDVYV